MKRIVFIVLMSVLLISSVSLAIGWGPEGWTPNPGRDKPENILFTVPELPLGSILSVFTCLAAIATFYGLKQLRK